MTLELQQKWLILQTYLDIFLSAYEELSMAIIENVDVFMSWKAYSDVDVTLTGLSNQLNFLSVANNALKICMQFIN